MQQHPDIHRERILILDFGSQYTQLIARRLREIGVYCEILPYDLAEERVEEFRPMGIVLSGGRAADRRPARSRPRRAPTDRGRRVAGHHRP